MSFGVVLIIYNLLFPIAVLIGLPTYLVKMIKRGNYGRDFWQRFGFYSNEAKKRLSGEAPIWVHAVSVGEVIIAQKLIRDLRAQAPEIPIVLSCTTSTGRELADKSAESIGYIAVYNPLDFPLVVASAFRNIRPRQIVLVEAEMWPNFLWWAKKRAIPVTLANARLSPRSERRYAKFRALTKPLFERLDQVLVPTEPDIERWTKLGVSPEKITCTGSIKYDQEGMPDPAEKVREFQQLLERVRGDQTGPVILAGSTHAGEEAFIGEVVLELQKTAPDIFYVVVPRHWERGKTVAKDLESAGFAPILKTEFEPENQAKSTNNKPTALIVNTTGELSAWYHLADIVLIGKSFLAEGGQNPIEPLLAGKPSVVGPNMQNFAALTEKLLAVDGCVMAEGASGLVVALQQLLADSDRRAQLAANGRGILAPDQGASERSAGEILAFADGKNITE
ncbi:MAG: 3-deoxy-D-manno-octulosonic-acid transferase [Verrucomicrobiales bacterium]|jgi:3-deoxy-D-manno-octulosonic-acid transferase